jgi:hypothetical protein
MLRSNRATNPATLALIRQPRILSTPRDNITWLESKPHASGRVLEGKTPGTDTPASAARRDAKLPATKQSSPARCVGLHGSPPASLAQKRIDLVPVWSSDGHAVEPFDVVDVASRNLA